ncbi:hypothetical protein EU555_35615 [Methylobacterium nonmethylotrophicum]|uniref:Uncharacterized protein n=1 Tax=Methylobacterium nonmethylotrophicum TaxID=1141884 RepID=A0A4Z0NEA0_9HYPH|nr:hypothetical protein EU555_35615 [Methylobacterium nonmethylotrophicum]
MPSTPDGPYRLPHEVRDRLASSLAPFRNREAAFALAVFLARFWTVPGRLMTAFAIDRRSLADHRDLGLSEARVRGALKALVAVGFLDPVEQAAGRRYQRTEHGLHRRPVMHRFGAEFGVIFDRANRRARTTREACSAARRPIIPTTRPAAPRPSSSVPAASRPTAVPIAMPTRPNSNPSGSVLYMGDQNPAEPLSPLEAAIERLRRGVGA